MINKTLLVKLFARFSVGLLIALVNPSYAQSESDPQAQTDKQASDTGQYSPISREYHLKAAFLRYVAKFVEWPAQSMSTGTINLCVLGLVPSYEALSSIDGKVVNDRTIAISKISDVSEAKGKCQILFITKTEQDNLKKIIKAVDDLPILAFGDMEHFAEQGGDMNFYILNNRLAIMINPPSVERSKLKISERMLKVVTVVPPVNETEKPAT